MFSNLRDQRKLASYAHIFVNINISEGLPEDVEMIIGYHKLIQKIGYEGVSFNDIKCKKIDI